VTNVPVVLSVDEAPTWGRIVVNYSSDTKGVYVSEAS